MAFIGIDLGTTNSVAAFFHPKARKVTVLENDTGDPNIPPDERTLVRSAVALRDGRYLRGWEAFTHAKHDSPNTVFSVKRLMGRGYNDRQEYGAGANRGRLIRELMRKNWDFEIVQPKGATGDSVAVLLEGKEHTPQEVSKEILLEVCRVAEASLGERIDGAVITVPAYFNEKQCAATVEAATSAGITVQQILDEPTAAAKAFAMETLDLSVRPVLVYDLGGGTFDVSLLEIQGPNIRVQSIDGDNWLGGDDFDGEIVDALANFIHSKTGKDITTNKALRFELRLRAEKAKKELSEEEPARILMKDLIPDLPEVRLARDRQSLQKMRSESGGAPCLPRAYEEMIGGYVEQTLTLVHDVLQKSQYEPDEIVKVLLVGGATKTPLVRKRLADVFGGDKIEVRRVDPMLAVAVGAAYVSDLLAQRGAVVCPWRLPDNTLCATPNQPADKVCARCRHPLPVIVEPPTERPYGIEIYDRQMKRSVFHQVIRRGTRYPLKEPAKTTVYAPATRILKVRFFAGQKWERGDFCEKVEKNEYQGTVWMVLAPGTPVGAEVQVGLNLSKNKEMVDISIECERKVVQKQMLSRGGREEALGLRIESVFQRIEMLRERKEMKPERARELIDRGCSIMESLMATYRSSSEMDRHGVLTEIEGQIAVWEAAVVEEPPDGDPLLEFANDILRFGYFVLGVYAWLLEAKGLIGDVKACLQELQGAIKRYCEARDGRDEAATQHTREEIGIAPFKLLAELHDRHLNLLLGIRAAINFAKGQGIDEMAGADKAVGLGERKPEMRERAGSAEGMRDAAEIEREQQIIITYLKAAIGEGDPKEREKKLKKVQDAYRKIEPFVLKWVSKEKEP